jgi:hypothetical protein
LLAAPGLVANRAFATEALRRTDGTNEAITRPPVRSGKSQARCLMPKNQKPNVEIHPALWSRLVPHLTGTYPHDALLVEAFCEIFKVPLRAVATKMRKHLASDALN